MQSKIKIKLKLKYIEIMNKLTTVQGCLLDYKYITNDYKLIAIQQTEILGQLKDTGDLNTDGTQSMFVLIILEKNQRDGINISQGSVTFL